MKKFLLPVACFAGALAMNAETTPVTISNGYNADVVAENFMNETTDKVNHPYMDGHHSCFVVNDGMMVTGGIPADGVITTDAGHKYQLASFTANNCLYLGKGGDEGTLEFSSPVAASKFYILGVGTNIDDSHTKPSFTAVINYTDGTSTELTDKVLPDWGDGNNVSYVYRCTQRFRADAGSNPENGNFRVNEVALDADAAKEAKSIKFTSTCADGEWGPLMLNILAVTADKDTNAIADIAADNVEVEAIYTLDGVRRADFVKGLNLVKYTDGSVRKVLVK